MVIETTEATSLLPGALRRAGQKRWWRHLAFGLALLLAGAVGWWASRVALAPPMMAEADTPTSVTAAVTETSVGRTLSYMVTVTQPFTSVATNSLAGIVTEVGAGGLVESGDRLFSVAGQSAFAAPGAIPFFRDLGVSAQGDDVAQLQQMLADLGYPISVTGQYGATTANIVRSWQRATNQPVTGTIPLGTVLAIPDLPAVVRIGDSLRVGDQVAGGETAVLARSGEPVFTLNLNPDQAALIPAGAAVEVRAGDQIWPAVTGDSIVDEFGGISTFLSAPDGSLVCGDQCDTLTDSEHSTLLSTVNVVPVTNGPGIPSAAIQSGPTGETFVFLPTGQQVPVTVLASSDGVAIVDGIDVGTEVLVFGEPGES